MATAPAGNSPAVFELKSASLTLIALLLKTTDLKALARELEQRFGATPQAFSDDPVVIDLSPVQAEPGRIDFKRLQTLLRARRLLPMAVKGGSTEQMAAALAAGLGEAPEDPPPPPRVETVVREVEVVREVVREVSVPTMVVDRPLRSGQQVYAKGGDLVVLAAVNFGAEVIADGNIHVYAPLRGKAIAGAKGNTNARIFTTCLEPELIAIAGTYRTTETAIPADVIGKAAQIRLVDDRLVMEPLKS